MDDTDSAHGGPSAEDQPSLLNLAPLKPSIDSTEQIEAHSTSVFTIAMDRPRTQPSLGSSRLFVDIVAVLSGIVVVVGPIFSYVSNSDKKELTIVEFKPQLVIPDDSLTAKVELIVNSQKVPRLWLYRLILTNTGAKALGKDDFRDGPPSIIIEAEKPVSTEPLIADATVGDQSGQRNSGFSIKPSQQAVTLEYTPITLNSGDRVEISVLSQRADLKFRTGGKLWEGQIRFVPNSQDPLLNPPHNTVVFAAWLKEHRWFPFAIGVLLLSLSVMNCQLLYSFLVPIGHWREYIMLLSAGILILIALLIFALPFSL